MGSLLRATCVLAASMALAVTAAGSAGTLPEPVLSAVHAPVAGWAATPPGWVAVYVEGKGSGWCGLDGASWWVALVEPSSPLGRVTATRRIVGAMCGNSLSWVRAGRFSDGRHPEVAFMLWATPSLGATTYIYRIDGSHLRRLAAFPGDRVALSRGTVTVRFENAGRSPTGKAREVFRFEGGRYRPAGG